MIVLPQVKMDDIESVDLARFKRANSRRRKESKVTFNLSDSVETVSSRITDIWVMSAEVKVK